MIRVRFMAMAPGVRLGPYEITTRIGVGGMGEGYQATTAPYRRGRPDGRL